MGIRPIEQGRSYYGHALRIGNGFNDEPVWLRSTDYSINSAPCQGCQRMYAREFKATIPEIFTSEEPRPMVSLVLARPEACPDFPPHIDLTPLNRSDEPRTTVMPPSAAMDLPTAQLYLEGYPIAMAFARIWRSRLCGAHSSLAIVYTPRDCSTMVSSIRESPRQSHPRLQNHSPHRTFAYGRDDVV